MAHTGNNMNDSTMDSPQMKSYHTWLKNAYAMEQDIVQFLESQLDDAEDFPELRAKIQGHMEVSKQHAESVKGILEQHGDDISSVKSLLSTLMGATKGITSEMAKDKVMKGLIADYATEHLEIASYQALISTAKHLGDMQSVPVFEQILRQEQEMANWLGSNMETYTMKFLDMQDNEEE